MILRRAAAPACALLLVSASARAQPTDESRADALFKEGKAAMAENDLARACARFEESERLQAAAGTLLNWADCEERSGHLAKALDLFTQGRARLADGDFRVAFADGRIQGLARQVPSVAIALRAGSPPGTRVFLDGARVDLSKAGTATWVDPGRHVITVDAAGRAEARVELALSAGERRSVDVEAGEPLAGAAGASRPDARRTLAYVALGAGGVLLVTGVVTGLMTMSAASTYKDHCTAGVCDADGLDAASRGRTLEVISPVTFVLGALGAGAGAYLLLTSPKASGTSAAVAPLVGAGGGGVSVVGAF